MTLVICVSHLSNRWKRLARTLYACRNQVVPFFLLLTSATHSLQLLHSPSQTSGLPSMRRVSSGSRNALPVAALMPCVKLLSYQKAEFLRTSQRPGLHIPHCTSVSIVVDADMVKTHPSLALVPGPADPAWCVEVAFEAQLLLARLQLGIARIHIFGRRLQRFLEQASVQLGRIAELAIWRVERTAFATALEHAKDAVGEQRRWIRKLWHVGS